VPDISEISFGALARAQASLPQTETWRKRKSGRKDESKDSEEERNNRRHDDKSTSKRSKESLKVRENKHAPTEMSSKRQVSRRREVIEVKKVEYRDPRFDPAVGHVDDTKLKKAYSFLDDYRDDEMKQLRESIKKTKNTSEKEDMKRTLKSMESRKKAKSRKEHEEKILDEHKKREKELVRQGKQPFYLKKAEQKKRFLLDQFASMSSGQVNRAIEKKRKKTAGREKKELGQLQRVQRRH
jgi:ribosomal RNA-processing protein 36